MYEQSVGLTSYDQANEQLKTFCKTNKTGFLVQKYSGYVLYYRNRPQHSKKKSFWSSENFEDEDKALFVSAGYLNEDWKNSIVDLSVDVCVINDNGCLIKLYS